MAPLLRDRRVLDYSILAIQEPWRNPVVDTTHNPPETAAEFTLIWPTIHPEAPKVCMYVRKGLNWHLAYLDRFAISIYITPTPTPTPTSTIPTPNQPLIFIHNIYNPPAVTSNPGVSSLRGALAAADTLQTPYDKQHIVVGDFNILDTPWHHCCPTAAHNTPRADDLRQLLETRPLLAATPTGLITRPASFGSLEWRLPHYDNDASNIDTEPSTGDADAQAFFGTTGTTIDLTFASWDMLSQLRHVRVPDVSGISDHLPIESEFNITLQRHTPPPRRNWKAADIPKLRTEALRHLQALPRPPTSLEPTLIDAYVNDMTLAITRAVDAAVPWSLPTPRSKPGFTPRCRELQKAARQARRGLARYRQQHHTNPPADMVADFRQKLGRSRKLICRLRRDAHRDRVSKASGDQRQVWGLSRWAKGRAAAYQAFTPPIQRSEGLAYTPHDKAKALSDSFFPPPPTADLTDLQGFQYPQQLEVPDITPQEVLREIQRPGPDKAPGPDMIPNRALQALADILAPGLTTLYNICLHAGYCPSHYRDSRTVALRKPGKDDYSKPKSYRPIALLNTIGKVLEGVLAVRLSYLAERYDLLPDHHFGGRRGQGTETALHTVLEIVQAAWKRGLQVSVLFLDISGAFDNVSHARLIHNLRKRRVPEVIIRWLCSFLQGRHTILSLPEYDTPRAPILTGIPQGSPLSPILYLFYNADLMGYDTIPLGDLDSLDSLRPMTLGGQDPPNTATNTTNNADAQPEEHPEGPPTPNQASIGALKTGPAPKTTFARPNVCLRNPDRGGVGGYIGQATQPGGHTARGLPNTYANDSLNDAPGVPRPATSRDHSTPGGPRNDTDAAAQATRLGYIDDTSMVVVSPDTATNCRVLTHLFDTVCRPWAATHASLFAPEKFALVHLHNPTECQGDRRCPGLGPPLTLGDQTVSPAPYARLLGMLIDQHLSFDKHLESVDARCSRGLQAIASLGGSSWGLSGHDRRLIYNACIAPVALYAASVWAKPRIRGFMRAHDRQVRTLTRIQRRAGQLITGAFRTTAADALDAELYLLPMRQRLRQARLQALTRTATLPRYAQIRQIRTYHRDPRLHSPLEASEEELLLQAGVDTEDLETRWPYVVPPWWEAPPVTIDTTKDLAITTHNIHCIAYTNAPKIYTDGSGIHGRVGASAVCRDPPRVRQAYMGTENTDTVPVAELAGIVLALRMAMEEPELHGPVEVYTDNQGALRTLRNPQQSSGQYLVREIIDLLEARRLRQWGTAFFWIPAHLGVPGNEMADLHAKLATGWRLKGTGKPAPPLWGLPQKALRSAVDRQIKQQSKDRWTTYWSHDTTPGATLRRVLPTPNKAIFRLYQGLDTPERTVLTQLRTGKIGLNAYLHTIKVRDSPICENCNLRVPETPHHVLFHCPRYGALRATYWGPTPQDRPRNLREALADAKWTHQTARLALATGRLTYLRPADPEALGTDPPDDPQATPEEPPERTQDGTT